MLRRMSLHQNDHHLLLLLLLILLLCRAAFHCRIIGHYIEFHPRPRLKSRRPTWSNLPDEALTIQPLWRTRWQNQIVDVINKTLVNDPTTQIPGMDVPRGQWSLLNRFRTDAGPCRNSMHEWGYIASPLCDCGEHQTMRHIVNTITNDVD